MLNIQIWKCRREYVSRMRGYYKWRSSECQNEQHVWSIDISYSFIFCVHVHSVLVFIVEFSINYLVSWVSGN